MNTGIVSTLKKMPKIAGKNNETLGMPIKFLLVNIAN